MKPLVPPPQDYKWMFISKFNENYEWSIWMSGAIAWWGPNVVGFSFEVNFNHRIIYCCKYDRKFPKLNSRIIFKIVNLELTFSLNTYARSTHFVLLCWWVLTLRKNALQIEKWINCVSLIWHVNFNLISSNM